MRCGEHAAWGWNAALFTQEKEYRFGDQVHAGELHEITQDGSFKVNMQHGSAQKPEAAFTPPAWSSCRGAIS